MGVDAVEKLPNPGFRNAEWRAVLPVDGQGDRDAALLPESNNWGQSNNLIIGVRVIIHDWHVQ